MGSILSGRTQQAISDRLISLGTIKQKCKLVAFFIIATSNHKDYRLIAIDTYS